MADVEDKMREHRLRCFVHVMRRIEKDLVKAVQGGLESREGRAGVDPSSPGSR